MSKKSAYTYFFFLFFFFVVAYCFETGFHYVTQASLEFAVLQPQSP
jgi:hypothetical protein